MKLKMCEEFFYHVEETENLLNKLNTSKENVLRNNENINFYCGEWIKIIVNDFKTHCVKPAENLNKVAKIYNISPEKIKIDNNLTTERLFIGQMLKIYDKQ